jgi:hypothetical protein
MIGRGTPGGGERAPGGAPRRDREMSDGCPIRGRDPRASVRAFRAFRAGGRPVRPCRRRGTAFGRVAEHGIATVVLGLGLAVLASCGPGAGPGALAPTQAWDERLADAFDDGTDFVTPLRTIVGTPWFEDYGRQLERRLAEADEVAVVRVRTIQPDAGGHGYGFVEIEIEESLVGPAAPGTVLKLDVSPDSTSAQRLDGEQARIRDIGRFVAYIRLYEDPLGQTRAHWHLSPRDDDLVATIRRTVAAP